LSRWQQTELPVTSYWFETIIFLDEKIGRMKSMKVGCENPSNIKCKVCMAVIVAL
jgi:hypothetical protein